MWNSEELSARFRHQAEDAERYLAEVRGKLKRSRSYEHVFDEHRHASMFITICMGERF